MLNQVTKNVKVRFIENDEEETDFSINCLRVKIENNIKNRKMENKRILRNNWKHIEAEITSIK